SWAIPAELTEYSIFIQESYYDKLWMNCVYYGLFERSQESHLMEPVIAKNYTISEDKKVIRVDINPNAYFSNGDKVTAYDVDYTYKLFMTKTLNTPYYKELTSLFENNDSIKAIDYDTVEFKFKKPYAFALSALSHGIINKKLVSQYIEENGYKLTVLDQALVTSTGPYMLNVSEFNTSKSIITLRPNPYWSITEKPTVNNLIFQYISGKDTAISALANGTVDIVDAGYYAKEIDFENVDVDILVAKSTSTEEMAINMKHPIIGTGELTPLGTAEAAKKIRQAISHAVPRETLVEKIYYGTAVPGISPMPEGCVGFDSSLEPYTYDIDLAVQLIEEAGFTRNTATDTTGTATLLVITLISICYTVILKRKKK
ncbi:MAG: ABC transporter substrate-binding protein, partial [Candidatus Heimdallarchaeaceae archaeon]